MEILVMIFLLVLSGGFIIVQIIENLNERYELKQLSRKQEEEEDDESNSGVVIHANDTDQYKDLKKRIAKLEKELEKYKRKNKR